MVVDKQGSDLFLRTMAKPRIRILGRVQQVSDEVISKEQMMAMCDRLLETEQRKRQLVENNDIDFVYTEEDIGRFRINIFVQRGTLGLVARHVHWTVKSFEELNLPKKLLTTFYTIFQIYLMQGFQKFKGK